MIPETEGEILFLDEVDSTNTYVRDRFDELSDLTLVVADRQTAGRGRLGRKWLSPSGLNFYGTFCFRNVRDGFHAGVLCGVALIRTLAEAAPEVDCYLKWPNDVYVGKAKLAGLLGEGVLRQGKIAGIAFGIGVNINMTPEHFAGLDQRATSLKIASGRDFDVVFIAKSLAKSLKRCYINYLDSFDGIFSEWRRANRLIGKPIALISADGRRYEGIFRDVTGRGELLLEYACPDGTAAVRAFNCGDVSDRKSVV